MAAPGSSHDRPRATRWEILGARLRIWTLPRGVAAPPPVSRRAVAAALAGLLAAGFVLAAVVVPAIDDAKRRGVAREHAASAASKRRERARVVAGLLDGPVREVRCVPAGGAPASRLRLECLAVTSSLAVGGASTPTRSGHPFAVSGSLADGRYAWCKENAPPGEGASGTGVFVALPAACTR